MKNILVILVVLATLSNCKQAENSKESKSAEVVQDTKSSQIVLGNFSLDLPEGWTQEQADNTMRVTQFVNTANSQFKIAVFFFGEQDMIDDNINRWKSQFSELESSQKLNLKHSSITAIKLLGTYKKKPFPMSRDFVETPDYGTLAAIIPSDAGPFYFKLSAPEDFIQKHEGDFIDLLNSYSRH